MREEIAMNKRKLLVILMAVSLLMTGCAAEPKTSNPHNASWIDSSLASSVESVKRLDKAGYLYSVDYKADYYSETVLTLLSSMGYLDTGCSAFITADQDGNILTCRNYDYKHLDSDGHTTGLNVIVSCSPSEGYRSVGVADAYWLDAEGLTFVAGAPDDGVTDISALGLLPYACVDGMNEKGLTVSILKLDIKPGESMANQQEAGKPSVAHSVLLRWMLDRCATVEEAVALAESVNMKAAISDMHLFVTDASGNSVVLEWRHDKLAVTETNAVTNFYVGFDDGEDVYKDGVLTEKLAMTSGSLREYHYGYGHGYHRFVQIVAGLDRYADPANPPALSVMRESQAMDILRVAAQDPGTEATSMTQYSVIYNASDLTAHLWVQQDYATLFTFAVDR